MGQANFKVPWAKLVEVQLINVGRGTTNDFPVNLAELNDALIYAIAVVDSTVLTTAPSGNVVAVAADLAKGSLTLARMPGSVKQQDLVPIYLMARELNSGEWYEVEPFRWSATSSKFYCLAAGLTAGQSFCFLFAYLPMKEAIKRWGVAKVEQILGEKI
jgi:hypothetical protein